MVFGLKGKKKNASRRRYGGESKGTYEKGAYRRAYYSDDEYSSPGGSYYDDEGMGYYYDEYLEDELDEMDMRDEERELVTRDQVLGELRAQAAADALGQSLEQMGYNLDNCDSFYSLSDTEAKDNRYIIQPKESDISNGVDQKKKSSKSRRSRKSKKKKAKASRSRYTVTSDDDDDDDEFTEDYTRTHRARDYDTYATSFDSDEDSYFEDGTYITGRDSRFTDPASRFTGKTSRFSSRRTGKLTGKNRKSKSRRRGDLDSTYYSRGTDWTNGDSSYYRTVGDDSTLSSMSSSENSEMEDTMYTEVTSKSGRADDVRIRSGHKSRRHGKKEKRQREMAAIQERNSEEESDFEEPKERKRRTERKPPTNWKRTGSSRLSGSSQIGAMRSVTSSKDEREVQKKKENPKEKRKEHRKESSSRSISSSKKSDKKQKSNDKEKKQKPSKSAEEVDGPLSSDPESHKENDEEPHEAVRQRTRKSGKHKTADGDERPTEADTKVTKRKSSKREKKHESSESEETEKQEERTKRSKKSGKNSSEHADADLPPEIKDGVSDLSEPEIEPETNKTNASKKSKKSRSRRNGRDIAEDSEVDENDDNERDHVHRKQSMKSKRSQKELASDSEDNITRKDGQKKSDATKKKGEERKQKSADTSASKASKSQAAKTIVSNTDGKAKNDKVGSKAHPETPKMDDEKSTKTSGTKTSKMSHAFTLASKKFWPRQFLSQRNKKGQGAEGAPESTLDDGENDEAPPQSREPMETSQERKLQDGTSVKGNPSKSAANHDLPTINNASDDKEEPKDERDDDNIVSRDRSQFSPRSRGRSQSYNKSSRRDGRSRSPSRSRSYSKGPENAHTKAKSYKQETLGEVRQEEGILPPSNREHKTNEDEVGAANQMNSSVGICEVAAMAALIPLAPFAAMYSCYTADATQAMIGGATEACAQECKDVSACNDTHEAEVKRNTSIDENTRSSKKSKSKKSGKFDDSTVKTSEKSLKSTRTSGDRSRKSKHNKPSALTRIPTLEEAFASVANSPYSPSKLSRLLSPRSPRSKERVRVTRIQEAEEGFESFLPGSFECPPFSDTTTVASHAKSLLSSKKSPQNKPLALQDGPSIQRVQPPASEELAMENNPSKDQTKSQTTKPKKGKRWLPKMPKILPKKKQEREQEDRVVYVMELPKQTEEQQEARKDEIAPSRLPSHLPMKQSRKKSNNVTDTESMKALNSYWAETPTAYKARQMVEEQDEGGDFGEPFSPGGGDLAPFACSAKTKACANYDGDFDRSILGEEDIPIDMNPRKSRSKNSRNSRNSWSRRNSSSEQKNRSSSGGHVGRNASQEDILKYYDLDQTLSDVMDARQTLENAYGQHSGGASFDHTIDEQLVELLAHMAEMDHDDAVEIEAAIKKLKRHARKLGISERDLLFSVKSAEESALSMTGNDDLSLQDNLRMPSTFGDKMLDAFEGYFGRK